MTAQLLTENREDLIVAFAGVALHGLLAGGQAIVGQGGAGHNALVATAAFDIAREFLRQAQEVKA